MTDFNEIWTQAKRTVRSWFGLGTAWQAAPEAREMILRGQTALDFYDGNAPKPLRVGLNKPDDNVFVNYPEAIVETGVNFLFGDELKIAVGTDADRGDEDYLESVWPAASRAEDLIDLATDGAIFGSAWLKIRIAESGAPQIVVLDPANMYAVSDAHDYRRVEKYVCQYRREIAPAKFLWHKEENARRADGGWIISEYDSTDGYDWQPAGESEWDYEFAPVFHTKNLPNSKSFYGKPDLTNSVLDLCRYLARLDSLIGKIVRVHSSPKPYARGMQRQDLQIGTEDVLFLGTNPDATLGLLEMSGDLNGALAYRRLLREALAEISKCPEITTGKTENVGQLSGRALQILYAPMLKQTAKKRLLYGRLLAEVVAALMALGGRQVKTGEIKLHWAALVPPDPKEEAETGILLKNCGFSEDTIIRKLGGDAAHEREMRARESDQIAAGALNAFNAGDGLN